MSLTREEQERYANLRYKLGVDLYEFFVNVSRLLNPEGYLVVEILKGHVTK